jgi:hypothetical protein
VGTSGSHGVVLAILWGGGLGSQNRQCFALTAKRLNCNPSCFLRHNNKSPGKTGAFGFLDYQFCADRLNRLSGR